MSLDIVKVSIVVSKIYFDSALVEPECNSGKFRIMSFSPSVASFIFVCLFKVPTCSYVLNRQTDLTGVLHYGSVQVPGRASLGILKSVNPQKLV